MVDEEARRGLGQARRSVEDGDDEPQFGETDAILRLDAREEQRHGELVEMAAEMGGADRPDDSHIAPEITFLRFPP